MSGHCSFADPEKEIFDALISGTTDKLLKKRAWLTKVTNTEKAIEEGTVNETLALSTETTSSINAINAVQGNSRAITCYNCKEEGNIKRNCPKKDVGLRCYRCDGIGHFAAKCTDKFAKAKCFICGRLGHIASRCKETNEHKRPLEKTMDTKEGNKRMKLEGRKADKKETINFLIGGR